MKQVFLDTDVVLDFLMKRKQFAYESMLIFDHSVKQKLKLFISSLSVNNINYIVSKMETKKKAKENILAILKLVDVLPVSKTTIEKSLYSDFSDFEDGIQNFCAEEGGLRVIVTRNVKDYSKSKLTIQTPLEFLTKLEK